MEGGSGSDKFWILRLCLSAYIFTIYVKGSEKSNHKPPVLLVI